MVNHVFKTNTSESNGGGITSEISSLSERCSPRKNHLTWVNVNTASPPPPLHSDYDKN